MFGKKHTEEAKAKIRTRALGRISYIRTEDKKSFMSELKRVWWNEHSELKEIWSKNQKGEKGSNWQGGKTEAAFTDRRGVKYNTWRTSVFTRDNFTCQICFLRGGWNKKLKKRVILNADHIKLYSLYPELRYNIENGRTLCLGCHRQTESWGGLTKFKKQYVEA